MRRETLEMLDGRVYYSEDNWHTIWQAGEKPRKVTDKGEADRIRFLVVAQSSGGPD